MEIRNIGRSGLKVSLVGLGCNNFGGRIDFEATKRVVHRALDQGITLFDTADAYGNRGGSETELGQVLGDRRKDIVLATKFGWEMNDSGTLSGGSRRYVMSAVEGSLRRLKTDWIDLYQFHKPDPATPIEETLRAMEDLVRQGKVRYVGCSNFSGWQVADAIWTGRTLGASLLVSVQNEYNLFYRAMEKEVVPAIKAYGLGLLAYYPLAGGLLSGKYRRDAPMPEGARLTTTPRMANRYVNDANWQVVEKLDAFAKERGHSLVELAFGWMASHAFVPSVIAGATKPEQIDTNVAAIGWRLGADDLTAIDAIAKGASID